MLRQHQDVANNNRRCRSYASLDPAYKTFTRRNMDIRTQLLRKHSRENADFVQQYVEQNPQSLIELMVCFFSEEIKVVQRAAQVVGNFGREHPEALSPWWGEMAEACENPIHIAIVRNVTRYFSELELKIEPDLERRLMELFGKYSFDAAQPVAVRVFAMQFIADRANRYPKYGPQLQTVLERDMPGGSTGFRNRGQKILKQLGS